MSEVRMNKKWVFQFDMRDKTSGAMSFAEFEILGTDDFFQAVRKLEKETTDERKSYEMSLIQAFRAEDVQINKKSFAVTTKEAETL